VKQGDTEALEELYARYSAQVFAVARRRCGSVLAGDITEQVFLSLWRSPHEFEPGLDSMGHQLVATAERYADGLCASPARADGRAALDPVEMLAALPEEQALALSVVAVGGCTFQQAADLLDVDESTVREHVTRGLRALRHSRAGSSSVVH
jgi:DNA-directed RNA polymerase specialized sigma24 family protein